MNPDESDRHIDVAFLELIECEFTDATIVKDLRRITLCLGLAAVPVGMKFGDIASKSVFSDDATIAEPNLSSP
jgi:hypothetical protein